MIKPSPSSAPLDTFIKDALKADGADLPSVDWSEVEVLIRHEKKSFSVDINKKTIIRFSAGAVLLILVCSIIKIFQYSSSPEEPEQSIAPEQNTFAVMDTEKAIITTDSASATTNTFNSDSFLITANKKKADSAYSAAMPADTASLKGIKEKQLSAIVKTTQKKENKKTKGSSLTDSAVEKKDNIPSLANDSLKTSSAKEIKTPGDSISSADTTNKKMPASKNKSKKKTKKTAVAPVTETQPDSLKRQ